MKISKSNYFLLIVFLICFFLLFLPSISFDRVEAEGKIGRIEVRGNRVKYYTELADAEYEEHLVIGTRTRRTCPCPKNGVCPSCWQYTCGVKWVEYIEPTEECNPNILRRDCQSVCGPPDACCDCGRCIVKCDDWEICEDCGTWQIAERKSEGPVTLAGRERPMCVCKGKCIDVLEVPEDIRFYNNPNYPTYVDEPEEPCKPEETKDPENIFLPVKFDWDDVQGWAWGWRKERRDDVCPKDRCYKEHPYCPVWAGYKQRYELSECVQIYQVVIRGTEPTEEQKEKEIKKGEMRDCQALAKIDELIKKGREAYLEGNLDKVDQNKKEIERIKEEELIITEYRAMIKYAKEKVTIQYIKEDGEVSEPIVVKRDELPEIPLVRLGKSEIIVPLPFCPCFFKSGRAYELKIRACCYELEALENNPFGDEHHPEHCGEWSEWQKFTTNQAPELKTPHDPDWEGTEFQSYLDYWSTRDPKEPPFPPLPLDVDLKWCETDFRCEFRQLPLSYRLRFYEVQEVQNGNNEYEYKCHPYLLIADKCRPYNLIFSMKLKCPLRPLGTFPPWWYLSPEFPNRIFDYFYKDTTYAWSVAVCKDEHPLDRDPPRCTDFSQKWRFKITEELERSTLISPYNDPRGDIPVGLPVELKWQDKLGPASYRFEIFQNGTLIKQGVTTAHFIVLDLPLLSVNTIYSWRILPCWDLEGEECRQDGDGWSEKWYFETTGQIPLPGTLIPHGPDIPIPTFFTWRHVPGAKSYVFNIQGNGLDKTKIIETDEAKVIIRDVEWIEFTLDFPYLQPETTYFWKVKTCARQAGEECGPWSDNPYDGVVRGFDTFKIPAPSSPEPEDNAEFFIPDPPRHFSWDLAGVRFSQFEIEYTRATDGETDECVALVGAKKTEIITGNHILFNPLALFEGLKCRGEYRWRVRGCLDRECTEAGTGEWSNWWNFTLAEEAPPERIGIGAGLVPCGRRFDNPDTPWDETDNCQPRHIFVLLYLVLNFVLWTMVPLILVILVVATGAMFYFSLSTGTTETIPKVKALWKSAGIGLLIIFLGWNVVCLILTLFGYQVGIFGPWWRI